MTETEHEAPDAPGDDDVTLPADEPGTPDEPGPSDDEQDAEAEADEPTPEPEPAPEAHGPSQKELEERDKKADQSFDTYTRRVASLYEEDAQDLIPCPLCLFTPRGFVNKHSAGRLDPQHKDLVSSFLGLSRPAALKQSRHYHRCEPCDGHGKVATDSQVPGNEDIKCEDCDGWGFVPPPNLPRNGQAPADALPTLVAPSSPDLANPDPDNFGQPRYLPNGHENPNWMRLPSAWVEVAPWGRTAGLTAQDAVPAGGS